MKEIIAGFIIGLIVGGLAVHYHYNAKQDRQSVNQQTVNASANGKIDVTIDGLKKNGIDRNKIITRTKEIYVPSESKNCSTPGDVLPANFRLLHNAFATGQAPDPGQVADASPVSTKDLADTIEANYSACLEWRDKLIGWQKREDVLQDAQSNLDRLNKPWWRIW